MRSRSDFARPSALAMALSLAAALAGCAVGDGHGSPSARCEGGPCDGGGYAPTRPTDLVSITIDPEAPTLDVSDGARPTVQFTAVGHQLDGTTRAITEDIVWGLDDDSLGEIDPATGRFTASGQAGFTHVSVGMVDGTELSGEAILRLNARAAAVETGASPADAARFEGAPPLASTAAPTVDYPLEGAVMPVNVFPPRITWTAHHGAPSPTDVYRVRLSRPNAVLEGYVPNTPGAERAWTPPAGAWAAFSRTNVGEPIALTVSVRTDAGAAESLVRRFRTVDAVISGSVYYWSPPTSRLHRVDVATGSRVEFLPEPGDQCIGCHAVSRDGQRLAARLEPGESLVGYDLTRDLRASPAPAVYRVPSTERRCVSFNPDATRVVAGDCGANPSSLELGLMDANTGARVGTVSAGISGYDPEWSPDGEVIAYTDRENNLVMADALADRLDGLVTVHSAAGAPAGLAMDWHPTWSPDSNWLIFQRGVDRRTAVGGAGSLWMVEAADDAEPPVRLDVLNGAVGQNDSFRPVFSPFDSGGYFWVLFTSTRPYGNTPASSNGTKQIWVAAITDEPDGAVAVSEVPFYLSGQDPSAAALSPYWVPLPCRSLGAACGAGSECCSDVCDPSGTCGTAPVCRDRGAPCGDDRDCCDGLTCVPGRICDSSPG